MERVPFRRDVEGLRAVGVLAVLLFHSGVRRLVPGGFVGVDVFFVISGFLITGNILAQLEGGRFRFGQFYLRRVRRLFPALLATVAATLIVTAICAAPNELAQIAASALASIFSVSNIYFWKQASYFDQGVIQKPLLHTWSLAVEEQFYLVWPALVVLLARGVRNRRWAIGILLLIVVFSTLAAEQVVGQAAAQAFYLTPYRMGEFAIGALCAWLPRPAAATSLQRNAAAASGLAMIVVAAVGFTESTRFPGLSTLLPCLGAALLIHVDGSRLADLVLTNPPVRAVGRISYSLYLVHWPIAAWMWQWRGEPGPLWSAASITVSFVLAAALYRFVEMPFRLGGEQPRAAVPARRFAALAISATLATAVVAAMIWQGHGWPWRYGEPLAHFAAETAAERDHRFQPYLKQCLTPGVAPCDAAVEGAANVFVLGDSHSPDALNALVSAYPDYHYVFLGQQGCQPMTREDADVLLTVEFFNRDQCIAHNARVLDGSLLAPADVVIINVLFDRYGPHELEHAVARIRRQTSAPVVVFGNYLVFDEEVPDMVMRHGVMQMDAFYARKLAEHAFKFEAALPAAAARAGFTFVSKQQLFCGGRDLAPCPLVIDGKLFTYDRHHLSVAAATALGRHLKAQYGALFDDLGSRHQHPHAGPGGTPR